MLFRSDGLDGVVRKGKTPLRRGGCGSFFEGSFGAEDGDVSRDWCGRGHWGLGVFVSRRSDEDVVGVNGDVLMERGDEESVKDFLSDSGGSGGIIDEEEQLQQSLL